MEPIISLEQLFFIQNSEENLVLIDVRSGVNGLNNYNSAHIEGAIYVNLETDLSDIHEDTSNGGRHPLPPLHIFSHFLGKLGITSAIRVIVYDDSYGGNGAARFWWMLRAVGHKKVQVLDGGLKYALNHGFPMSQTPTLPVGTTDYPVTHWRLGTVTIDQVEEATTNPGKVIVDVRAEERYLGIKEPIDLVAGHIPNAINMPYFENMDEEGLFLSKELLKEKYKKIYTHHTKDEIIFHCGSGVTACHSLLAIDYVGLPIPILYVGSWSEWYKNNEE